MKSRANKQAKDPMVGVSSCKSWIIIKSSFNPLPNHLPRWIECNAHLMHIGVQFGFMRTLKRDWMRIAVSMWTALNTCMFLSMHFHSLFQCWSGSLAKKQLLLSSRAHHNCSKNRLLSEAWAYSTGSTSTGWECWHSSHRKVFHKWCLTTCEYGEIKEKQREVMYLCSFCHHNVAELPSIGCDHCLK